MTMQTDGDLGRAALEGFGKLLMGMPSPRKLVYHGYLACLIKRALKADPEQVIVDIDYIMPHGPDGYAMTVTDFNGSKYRVTVECCE